MLKNLKKKTQLFHGKEETIKDQCRTNSIDHDQLHFHENTQLFHGRKNVYR